jgi:hypothetical protein
MEWNISSRVTRDISANVQLAMMVFKRMQLAGAITNEQLM